MNKDEMGHYCDNLAAASSLALLGASGLEGVQKSDSAISRNQKSKQLENAEEFNHYLSKSKQKIKSSFQRELTSKLDENSNASFPDGENESRDHQMAFEEYVRSQPDLHHGYSHNKYKCHRCKVGFPRMSFLSTHNRTLLHRQSSKLSHPIEKYLDPNRPFKCEVCVESFTQNNILLVHYNSVSHLHRLKQQQSHLIHSGESIEAATIPSSPFHKSSHLFGSSADNTQNDLTSTSNKKFSSKFCEASQVNENKLTIMNCNENIPSMSSCNSQMTPNCHLTRQLSQNTVLSSQCAELKNESRSLVSSYSRLGGQYQCSLCKASYNQLSLLDEHQCSELIHIYPSNGKLPLYSGAASVSKATPFNSSIADRMSTSEQQRNLSSTFQPLTFPQMYATTPSTSSFSQTLSTLSSLSELSSKSNTPQCSSQTFAPKTRDDPKLSNTVTTKLMPFCEASKVSSHQNTTRSTIEFQNISNNNQCSELPVTDLPYSRHSSYVPNNVCEKTNMHLALLENFGFECVMQYNEHCQKLQKGTCTTDLNKAVQPDEEQRENNKESEHLEEILHVKSDKRDINMIDLPELKKCTCRHCQKEFSSIWVLKAHEEEVHKDLLPLDCVFKFGKQFKKIMRSRHKSSAGKHAIEVKINQNFMITKKETIIPNFNVSSSITSIEKEPIKSLMKLPVEFSSAHAAQMMQQLPYFMGMNMLPPLLPMMMPLGAELFGMSPFSMLDPMTMFSQQHQQHHQKQNLPHPASPITQQTMGNVSQKSGRTRISDEQLNVLRTHFDINNSPSEEQIQEMSERTGLLQKVIKHWFRNTLFKERQRNKDSPYNFSVPPSTTLDLEEYEKVGRPAVKTELSSAISDTGTNSLVDNRYEPMKININSSIVQPSHAQKISNTVLDPQTDFTHSDVYTSMGAHMSPSSSLNTFCPISKLSLPVSFLSKTPADISDARQSRLIQLTPPYTSPSLHMTQQIRSSSPKQDPSLSTSYAASCTGSSSQERRTNRTRFTNHQMNVLQDFFEKNAYPKDDELESLSKQLDLSPRVIVVWFQNGRQKVRKVYENQPPASTNKESHETIDNMNQLVGANYQCQKCSKAFSQYYELIKHKRAVCYKDDDNGQISVSNTAASEEISYYDDEDDDKSQSESGDESKSESVFLRGSMTPSGIEYRCEKCNLTFDHLEKWKEHQAIHAAGLGLSLPRLQSHSSDLHLTFDGFPVSMNACSSDALNDGIVTKQWSEDGDSKDDQPKDKRMRTTILPEQLDYLYHIYQSDCNPSRKQLDAIATKVSLKKRVVQVWFQNTRARERKGHYRAHQQLIHKRCPFCKALFRAKTALEAHLATKHSDEIARNEVNVDNIPDELSDLQHQQHEAPLERNSPSITTQTSLPGSSTFGILNSFMPILTLPGVTTRVLGTADLLQTNMQRLYEDSFKKYIDELSHISSNHIKRESLSLPWEVTSTPVKVKQDDSPLDLSMTVPEGHNEKIPVHSTMQSCIVNTDGNLSRRHMSVEDSYSETQSESIDEINHIYANDSAPSPTSSSSNQFKSQNWQAGKRYRTQMSSMQIKVMKAIFVDYKTPTMSECEALGREIGLQKRVVQVWFQNARAKEKKSSLPYSDLPSSTSAAIVSPMSPNAEKCSLCGVHYSMQYSIQDHLFTKSHVDKVKEIVHGKRDLSTSESKTANMDARGDHLQKMSGKERKRKCSTSSIQNLPSSTNANNSTSHSSPACPNNGNFF